MLKKFVFTIIILHLVFTLSCGKKSSPTAPKNTQQKYPPVASFTANPTKGEAPLTVSFDASSSSDQDGQIVRYDWNFGDSSPITHDVTTQHIFQQAGNYNVVLTVTDNDSNANNKSAQITATEPPGPTLFPMYIGAQWAYDVGVYYKSITENQGANENGTIRMTVTDYDPENIQAELSVKGDLIYFASVPFPITIPNKVYIRETSDALERSDSPSGPWETTIKLGGSSWYNGGLILAGSNYRAFSLKQSTATTPAGIFSGYLVGASEDNWGQTYKTDDHEYYWKELFNSQVGLVWSKNYTYYDDKGDMYGPSIIWQEISLTGYAIPLPDGTVSQGGSGAFVQLIVDCSPGIPYPADSPPVVEDRGTQIHLQFSMDMDQNSVEQAFGVGSALAGGYPLLFTTAGSGSWDGNRHFIWTPAKPFVVNPPRSIYVYAKLGTGARSLSGTFLSEETIFIFSIK